MTLVAIQPLNFINQSGLRGKNQGLHKIGIR